MTIKIPTQKEQEETKKQGLFLSDKPEELIEKFYEFKTPLDVAKLLNIPKQAKK